MKKNSNENVKIIQKNILKVVREICIKNNYDYYLFFGTLIGAIRHKGFIPWDDDIDIVMPRNDYEKFINYCIENGDNIYPLRLVHYRTKKKYSIPIARIENSSYLIFDENNNSYDIGPFIDIYPLDGVGNNKNDIQSAIKRLNKWKKIGRLFKNHGFEKSNNVLLTKIRYAFYLIYEKIFDIWISYLDKRTRKVKIEDCKYIGIPIWQSDFQSYFDKSLLKKEYAIFEGEKYCVPSGYDKILKQIYGDYTKLPPLDKRKPYHFNNVYLINKV